MCSYIGTWHFIRNVDKNFDKRIIKKKLRKYMRGKGRLSLEGQRFLCMIRIISVINALPAGFIQLMWECISRQLLLWCKQSDVQEFIDHMTTYYIGTNEISAKLCTTSELSFWARIHHRSEMPIELLHRRYNHHSSYGNSPGIERFIETFRYDQCNMDTEVSINSGRGYNRRTDSIHGDTPRITKALVQESENFSVNIQRITDTMTDVEQIADAREEECSRYLVEVWKITHRGQDIFTRTSKRRGYRGLLWL